mgnify:CR=1 FL=1
MTTSLDIQAGGEFDKVRLLHSIFVEKKIPLDIEVKNDIGRIVVIITSYKQTIQEKVQLQRELSRIHIKGEFSGCDITEQYKKITKTYVYKKRKYFDELFSTYSLMDMEAKEIDFLLGTQSNIASHLVDIVEVTNLKVNVHEIVGEPFEKIDVGDLIHYRITVRLEYADFESNYELIKSIFLSLR